MKHHISKEEKELKLLEELKLRYIWEKEDQSIIDRQQLREVVSGTLGISDRHTVNGWIDFLLGAQFLEHNPTSQLINKGDGFQPRFIKMPRDSTRYFVNNHFVKKTIEELKKKLDPHTTQSTLDSSSNVNQSNLSSKFPSSTT